MMLRRCALFLSYDGSDENGLHGGLSGKDWLRARTWTYNERSEMTGCTSSDGSYSYFYDSIGNRTSSSSTSSNLVSVTHSYTANGLNQYDYVDSTALTYDADGNLTGDGRYSYAYDCENRLVTMTPVSPSAGDLAIV